MYDWPGGFGYLRRPNGRSLRIITPPSGLVVTTDQARDLWRVDPSENDSTINMCIGAAQDFFSYLGVTFGQGTYALDMDAFHDDPIELPVAPLITVSSISAVASDGTTSPVDTSLYSVQKEGRQQIGLVRLTYGNRWPNVRGDLGSASIQFTAGYTEATLPDALRMAILSVGQSRFDNRATLSPITIYTVPDEVIQGAEQFRVYA